MPDEPFDIALGDILKPHRWAMLPAYSQEEICGAILSIAVSPEGQVFLTQLIASYLLSHPADMRDVGKQDLVRELLDMVQQGVLIRRNRREVTNGTRGESEPISKW